MKRERVIHDGEGGTARQKERGQEEEEDGEGRGVMARGWGQQSEGRMRKRED